MPGKKAELSHVHSEDRQLLGAHQLRSAKDRTIATTNDREISSGERWIGNEVEVFVKELAVLLNDWSKIFSALRNIGTLTRTEQNNARIRFPMRFVSGRISRLHATNLNPPWSQGVTSPRS